MTENTEIKEKTKKWTKDKTVKELKSLMVIGILVFAFRSMFFEPFTIPSGSMIPTLLIGDFVLVNKMSYGLKVPFSEMFSSPIYLTEYKEPKRGDIIVFKYPKDQSTNYIKRLIGLPGDRIAIRKRIVYVNGEAIETKVADSKKYMEDMDEKYRRYNLLFFNTKTGEKDHIIQFNADDDEYGYNSNYEETVVPDGHYFVLGDNRDFSADSRYWGFVPKENIKGKAVLIWFSMYVPLFGQDLPFTFRPWRIGNLLN